MLAAGSPGAPSSLEDELTGTKRRISLSNCGVCGSAEAKYRCPACLKHSCSLPCVKKHKDETGCSGVRNKTAFVALSHFDEISLLSDYRFLEDTGRFADGATRDALIRTPFSSNKAKRLAACARKMNITLRFLPIAFTKSRENSTFFFSRESQFLWHLKLIFPQSSAEFIQRRVPDRHTLEQILTHYIHPSESDPVRRQKLKMYVRAPFDHVKVFMKAEGRKANSVRYHELDIGKSLRDNLSYKTLIEYPVLHVVLRDHCQDYPLKGPAQLASTCNSVAAKSQGANQGKKNKVPPSPPGSSAPGGTGICPGTHETSPEIEPPKEKRAKRETEEKQLEEGEIVESSDEVEGHSEEDTLVNKSCTGGDGTTGHADVLTDMKATKDELADSVGDDAAAAGIGELGHSGRGRCINKHISAADNGTVGASANVSMTKEDALTEPEPAHNPSLP